MNKYLTLIFILIITCFTIVGGMNIINQWTQVQLERAELLQSIGEV